MARLLYIIITTRSLQRLLAARPQLHGSITLPKANPTLHQVRGQTVSVCTVMIKVHRQIGQSRCASLPSDSHCLCARSTAVVLLIVVAKIDCLVTQLTIHVASASMDLQAQLVMPTQSVLLIVQMLHRAPPCIVISVSQRIIRLILAAAANPATLAKLRRPTRYVYRNHRYNPARAAWLKPSIWVAQLTLQV